jgi:hypothetical protein
MKKILTLLTGMLSLIAILVAGGCSTPDDPDNSTRYPDKVTIYLKTDGKGMDMKLLMSDSRDGAGIDADQHVADVGPDTKVVWMRAANSGIKKFTRIGPTEDGEIFPEDASTIVFQKRYRHRVPDKEIAPNAQQKYDVQYVPKGTDERKSADPYLRIRGTDTSNPD